MARGLTDQEIAELENQHGGSKGLTDEEILHLENVEAAKKATKGPSYGESFAKGFAQGPTFGFAPHAQAAVTGQSLPEAKYHYLNASEQNPNTYKAGNLAGSIAAQYLPGIGTVGSTLGMGFLKAAAQGGLMGASGAQNMGEAPGMVAKGAALNTGLHGLGVGVGGLARSLGPTALKQTAEERAVKAAIGGGNEPGWRKVAGTNTKNPGSIKKAKKNISKTGRDLLDEPGVITAGSSTADIAPRLSRAKNKYGNQIGDIENNMDLNHPNGSVSSKGVANDFVNYASKLPEHAEGRAIQDRLLNEGIDFSKKPFRTMGESTQWKNSREFKPNSPDLVVSNPKASNAIRSSISKGQEEAAKHQGVLDKYKNSKSKYKTFVTTEGEATKQGNKKLNNRSTSLTDYLSGGAAATTTAAAGNNPLVAGAVGILTSLANKFMRERGSSTAAVIANNLAKVMELNPMFVQKFGSAIIDAAQRGGPALMVTHHLLMQKPEYRQEFDKLSSEETQ